MIKKLAVMAFAVMAMSTSAQARCFSGASNPCGPNNPHTVHTRVSFYTVLQKIPCNNRAGYYIIGSNGQQWNDTRGVWPRGVHVGEHFKVVNSSFDSQGTHHGDVVWID